MRTMRQPGSNVDGLLDMIAFLPSELRMVEIGSYAGESTEMFFNSDKWELIYCVDHWKGRDHDEAEVAFDTRFFSKPGVIKLKMESEEGSKQFADASVGFVYIDASHRYEPAKRDIDLWLPKVKPGGYIGGHDYYGEFPGLIQAVYEKFHKPDHVFADSSWIVRAK